MSDPIIRLNTALEGRYRVESELGEGGMARVYLANDVKHGREVALTVLKPELGESLGTERFLREIEIASSNLSSITRAIALEARDTHISTSWGLARIATSID